MKDNKETLENFCITYELDKTRLKERFAENGFTYDLSNNQFKNKSSISS